jgi:DNA-binding transcriptional LysR family regulator
MELRHLRYFQAVATALSFSRAAERLHVAQPALSRQIADLERELGVLLLNRDRHKVSLTPAGQSFLRECGALLSHAAEAADKARRIAQGEAGELTLAFMTAPTFGFLPGLVREYRRRYPRVGLKILEMNPNHQLEAFEHGNLDIGFTRPLPHGAAGLGTQVIRREDLVAVLSPAHRFQARRRIRTAELSDERFVLQAREETTELFDHIVAMCQVHGFSPVISNAPNQMSTLLAMVAAGEGIGIVPEAVRQLANPGVSFHALSPKPTPIPLILAWRTNNETPTVRAMISLVREWLPRIRTKPK